MNIIMAETVSNKDRGLQYGDGFFTTAQIKSQSIQLWDLHLKRLQECQARLFFPALDWQQLTEYCAHIACKHEQGVLKIVITRGGGGRGYAPPAQAQPTVIVSVSDFPKRYKGLKSSGITVGLSQVQLGHQPLLAGLKTLNRLEQVLIKQQAQYLNVDDVLVTDINNEVIETSVGNIIAYKNNHFYTPKLDKCGIKGVYLRHLEQHNNIIPIRMSLEHLQDMEVLIVCNSLMECIHISQFNHKTYESNIAFEIIEHLQKSCVL